MATFQAKIGWKRLRMRENKNYRSISFLNDAQKRKKFKNTIISSFQAKIGWKRRRKRENKNYRSVTFLPDRLQKILKKQQKISKNFKIRLWDHFKPKQIGKD